MKKLLFFSSLMVLFLVFLVPAILVLGIRYIPNDSQPSLEATQGVFWKFDIRQSFVSEETNLTGVGLSIRNLNLKNDKDIVLELYDKDNSLLRTSTFTGKNIEDGGFVKFLFAEIADSQNKDFYFVLTAPDARAEFALQPFYTSEKPSWARELQFAGEKVDGSLSFVTFHHPQSKLGLIKEIYRGWFERFYADKPFFFFYGGLILILGVLLFI